MNITGERIKEERKKIRKTQKELGSLINVAVSTLSGYELGTSEPDFKTIKKLSEIFNCSVDYLLGRTELPELVVREHKGAQFHITKGHENKYTEEELEMALKIIDMMRDKK